MADESAPRRRGRPPTGVTPKRNIRMGETWTQGEALAARLGMTMTAYVEQALADRNARETRKLRRQAPSTCLECGMPTATEGDCPTCKAADQ